METPGRSQRTLVLGAIPILLGIGILGIVLWQRTRREGDPRKAPPPPALPTAPRKDPPPDVPRDPAPDPEAEARRLFESGLGKSAKQDYAGALRDFDQALVLKKDWSDAYYNRAVARTVLRDYPGAIRDYDRMVELKGASAETYYNRGVAKAALADYKEAKLDFTSALQLRAGWPEAYYNRGLARQHENDLEGARSDFEKALEVAPADWATRETVQKSLAELRKKP